MGTMPTVASSNVSAVDYVKETRTLTVQFHSGQTYEYTDVSPQTYAAMLRSPSPGSFVHRVLAPSYRSTVASSGGRKARQR